MKSFILIASLLFNIFHRSNAMVKLWVPNKSYSVRSNFKTGKLPTECQRVIFQSEMITPITLGPITSMRGLVLPIDGEVLFPPTGDILLGPSDENNCTIYNSRDAFFLDNIPSPWLGSNNWKSSLYNEAVPDLERLPCQYDDVIFPASSSFMINLPDITQKVKSVKIDDTYINEQQFLERASYTDSGQMFILNTNSETGVKIVDKECKLKAGCICQDTQSVVPEAILCEQRICDNVTCMYPIKPLGHCCNICGGALQFEIHVNKFNIEVFADILVEEILDLNFFPLNFFLYVSRVDENLIQLVITEKKYYSGKSTEIVDRISHVIKSYEWFNGLRDVYLSGRPSSLKGESVQIVGYTFLAVILLLGTIFLIYYPPRIIQQRRPVIFARFQNRGSILSTISDENAVPLASGFQNPMYSSGRKTTTPTQPEELLPPLSQPHSARMSELLANED